MNSITNFTAAFLLAGSAASAATLTFDGLSGETITSYSESGYTLSATDPSGDTHINDNFNNQVGTFGWHPGGDNTDPQGWTLTQDGGGAFELILFDFDAHEDSTFDLDYGGATFSGLSEGSYSPSGASVTAVTFWFSGSNEGWFDNIEVTDAPGEVPLPGGLPLAATGVFALALLTRKRRRAA